MTRWKCGGNGWKEIPVIQHLARKPGLVARSSVPPAAVERAVLDGFGDVLGLDGCSAAQIGDSTGDLQDAVVGAGAEAEALDGELHETLASSIQRAVTTYLPGVHLGIAVYAFLLFEPIGLNRSRPNHACAYTGRWLAIPSLVQFIERNGSNLDV